jgi:hypothetical protein
MVGEVAPGELLEERLCPGLPAVEGVARGAPAGSRADLTGGQVLGKPGGAVLRGEVACFGVATNPLGHELVEPVAGTSFAGALPSGNDRLPSIHCRP